MGSATVLLLFLLSATHVFSTATAASFTCNATAAASCSALVEYIPSNATTYAAIESLFQVSHLSLLAANNLSTSTPKSESISSLTRIPFPCACANQTGTSAHTPIYTVKAGDGLDAIARTTFNGLVTYQEIQVANGVKDANAIVVGQKLWIPLPCSCDPVGGRKVVHLGHVVAANTTVAEIAQAFGSDEATLLRLNGIANAKDLQAGEVIDVPLQACSSSISNTSLDYNLLVPNGSYALTANDCILCRCSSSQLDCHPTQGLSSSTCPASKCGSLYIGNTSTSGCDVETCAYAGYTNTTGFSILATNITTQSTCSNGGAPARLALKDTSLTIILFILHTTLLCYWFL